MTKPTQFNRCGATCTVLQSSIHDAVAAMKIADQERTNEVKTLQAEVERLSTAKSAPPPTSSSSNTEVTQLKAEIEKLKAELSKATTPSAKEGDLAVSNGSGGGSAAMYREMTVTNWHGRLGRTHMADVDIMTDAKKKELDVYLHTTLKKLFPEGRSHGAIDSKAIFKALAAMGLRMEQRTHFAETTLYGEVENLKATTLSRSRSYCSYSYSHGGSWVWYWNALALETLIELARYRGLFGSDGSLKDTV